MTIFPFFLPIPENEKQKTTVAGISFSSVAVPLNSFEEIFSKS